MADLTLDVAKSHAEAPYQTGYRPPKPVQPIAIPFANVLKYNPAQPRDDQGQWTGSGLPSLPKVEGILGAIGKADGGFTYHAVTGEQPLTGFALSIHRDREAMMDASKATVVALAEYAAKNWDLLKESGNFIGGWHNPDDGQVYLDVSTVVDTAEEAHQMARAHDQIAYFDLVKGQSIKIGVRKHGDETHSQSHGATRRPAHAGGFDRPVQAVDGPRSHARGDRGSEAHFAKVLKFDPDQPRDEGGKWSKIGGRSFTSDEGYEFHEQGPGRAWGIGLSNADKRALDSYSGFGYHDVNDLRRGTYKTRVIDHFVRAATPEEMRRVGWDPEKHEWVPSVKVPEGYKPGYEVDPRDTMSPERTERFGHPMGKREAKDYDPEDPYHRVDDGRIIVNQYYSPTPGGPPMMFSIRKPGPDQERLHEVQAQADALDDLIAHRGLVLDEPVVVQRGAYLPGVSFDDLHAMQYEGPNGEPPAEWEEKGFTSTFLGDAEGRAKGYPAAGKWESIQNRFPGEPLSAHENEVGTAVRFYITLPKGTKVADVEAARRLTHRFPRIPDPSPRPPDIEPEHWTTSDYNATPTVDTRDLDDPSRRSESEILLGSGARFRVTKVVHGYTTQTDGSLKPVKVAEVHLEYIGGGSSEGD